MSSDRYVVRPDEYAAKWFTGSNAQDVIDWASEVPLPSDSSDDYGAHMSIVSGELVLDSTIAPESGLSSGQPFWVVLAVRRSYSWNSTPLLHNDPNAYFLEADAFDHVFNRTLR